MSAPAIKTGDTSTGPRIRLVDRDGSPANLTGATVVMQVRNRPGEPFPTDVVDAEDGVVAVPRGDLEGGSARQSWTVEFEVTYSDGTVQTFPEVGYLQLDVWSDLDDR